MSRYKHCIVTAAALMAGLYCNTHKVYRDLRGGLASWGVLQHGQPGHDTAQGQRLRHGDAAVTTRRWGPQHGRLRAATRRLAATIQPCVREPGRTWVCWLGQQAIHLVHPAYFWTQYCF